MKNKLDLSKLTEDGKIVFDLYVDTLKIDEKTAIEILEQNKSAYYFITSNNIGFFPYYSELSILIKLTLFRFMYDFAPLKPIELELLKQYYPNVTLLTTNDYVPLNNTKVAAKDCVPLISFYQENYPKSDYIHKVLSNLKPE